MNSYIPRLILGLLVGNIALLLVVFWLVGLLALTLWLAAVLAVLITSSLALIKPLPDTGMRSTISLSVSEAQVLSTFIQRCTYLHFLSCTDSSDGLERYAVRTGDSDQAYEMSSVAHSIQKQLPQPSQPLTTPHPHSAAPVPKALNKTRF